MTYVSMNTSEGNSLRTQSLTMPHNETNSYTTFHGVRETDGTSLDNGTFPTLSYGDVTDVEMPKGSDSFRVTDEILLYWIVGTVGVIDNGFVIFVILKTKEMREKMTNMLIVNQSAIDFVMSLCCIINYPSLDYSIHTTGIWSDLYCLVWLNGFLWWAPMHASSFSLVFITLERYIEIVYPIKHKLYVTKKRMLVVLIFVWIFGYVYTGCLAFPTSAIKNGNCESVNIFPTPGHKALMGVCHFVIAYASPVAVMLFCYVHMVYVLRTRVSVKPTEAGRGSVVTSEAERRRSEKMAKVTRNILKTLFIVSLVFILCMTWSHVYYLFFNLGYEVDFTSTFYYIGIALSVVNCCVNPFIYAAQYRQFQKSVRAIFCNRIAPSGGTRSSTAVE